MPYDNVIIFGAGASVEAGVPLLANFVDTMWGYAVRGRGPHGQLSPEDKETLSKADEVRTRLERYSARANFNLRNVEDVMSLLSVDAFGGIVDADYRVWVNAIARTIELSCTFPDKFASEPTPQYPRTNYHEFWNVLLNTNLRHSPPAIITFNYDLVLERTLYEFFHHLPDQELKPAEPTCKILYHLPPHDFTVSAKPHPYYLPVPGSKPAHLVRHEGNRAEISYDTDSRIAIPYLKLHGSLNWCKSVTPDPEKPIPLSPRPLTAPTTAANSPLIMPPVFNKLSSPIIAPVWRAALEILRQAKHIIIVGYSLPRTDIYMQYFFKSAVGPNSNLQRITVFDPTLFRNHDADAEMRARYRDCFSPQFSERITFRPKKTRTLDEDDSASGPGTFFHFTQAMKHAPNDLLFIP